MNLCTEKIKSTINEYGTPLYLYDGDFIINQAKKLKASFQGFEILYSMKSNPNPEVVKILSTVCDGVEVTSERELETALRNGFMAGTITYGGPGKSDSEFKDAIIKYGLDIIDLETEREIQVMENLQKQYGKIPDLTLRINTAHKPTKALELMAGGPSVYGIDEEVATEVMSKYSTKLAGIHAHVASQVLDEDSLVTHYTKTAALAKEFSRILNFKLKVINFGGGIGVPYSDSHKPIDIRRLGELSQKAMDRIFPKDTTRPRLQLEIGRYIVAESGKFYTEIVDIKTSRGTNFIITDSGINGFSRPAMAWAEQHPCSIVSKENEPPKEKYRITGRSCLPTDILCNEAILPQPKIGDIIALDNAGAYGYTMSLLCWSNRKKKPGEVVI